jgi:3-hydroxyacyl-[acyl-carrier-protein] dehydratase
VRYYLLDRIDELKPLEWAVGTKCISLADDCFEHHFPGQPVYPGALLLETMAQLGGALLEISLRDALPYVPRCVLSSVTAKFRAFVKPGDRLSLRAEVLARHDDSAKVRVVSTCDDQRVCDGDLLYVFVRMDDPHLEASRAEYLDILTRTTRYVD